MKTVTKTALANVKQNSASVIFPISLRNSLYLSVPSVANTQMTLEFHFPPNSSMPYSNGQRMSFSSFLWYAILLILSRSSRHNTGGITQELH